MDEQHNDLVAFVLDEPEQAAREIARLRKIEAEKTLLRETYRKGTQVNKDQLPTTRHTLIYQPREMHLLAAGVVQRGDERLEYHDVRLYFPHPSEDPCGCRETYPQLQPGRLNHGPWCPNRTESNS